MQEFLVKVPDLIQMISLVLSAIVVLATVIVRITPSPKDDEVVSGIAQKLFKVLSWLPTIGINPKTQKLQEAYEELKEKNDSQKAS